MLTAITAIIVFGILITVHEAGHFVSAKLLGVRVLEFAIGMGPKVVSLNRGETKYSLRVLPIGGYCAMEGEDETSEDKKAFSNAKAWKKFIILVSGGFMNLVLGFIAMCMVFSASPEVSMPAVGSVIENSPAQQAGMLPGDTITRLNNTRVNLHVDIKYFLFNNPGEPVTVHVKRGAERLRFEITPQLAENGEYLIGYAARVENNNLWLILNNGFYGSIFTVKMVILSFYQLITGTIKVQDVSGPVGIIGEIGTAAKRGFLDVLSILALISINLGVFNLFPLPALDGGRIVFVALEKIRRKKIKAETEGKIHFIGLALLITLMIWVTVMDVGKLIK